VVSRQGAGTFVKRRPHPAVLRFAPMGSIADMQRCFEFRVALEGEAAWFAAERGDADGILRITQAIEALDEVVCKGNLGADADYEFHFAIAQAAANRFFISVMASLKKHIEFGINLTRSLSLMRPAARVAQVQAEHRAIYDVIWGGDASGARDAMRKHIENARTRMFEGQAAPLDTIDDPQAPIDRKSQLQHGRFDHEQTRCRWKEDEFTQSGSHPPQIAADRRCGRHGGGCIGAAAHISLCSIERRAEPRGRTRRRATGNMAR
jgi:DNA-binding FadR family transcriptional regulator